MPKIQYNCCFCSKPGEIQFEEPENVSRVALERLASLLPTKIACDRCAKYERTRRDLGRAIIGAAARLASFGLEDRDNLKPKLRPKLSRALTRFCENYQRRFNLRPLFEPNMVEDILERPESAGNLISQIHRMATT